VWVEAEHPREPAGSAAGGEFSAGGSASTPPTPTPKPPKWGKRDPDDGTVRIPYEGHEFRVYFDRQSASWRSDELVNVSGPGGAPVDFVGFNKDDVNEAITSGRLLDKLRHHGKAKAWDEALHPREPAGSGDGGQFTESGGGAWPAVRGGSASAILGRKATAQEDAAYDYFKSDIEAMIATRAEAEAATARWHNSEEARLAFVAAFDKPGQTFKALIKVADVAVRAALPAEMVARWEQMGQVKRDYTEREMVAWARENVMTVPPSSIGKALDMESVVRNPGALLTQLAGRLTPVALESEEGRSLVTETLTTWHKSHNGLRVKITSLYKFPEAPAPSVEGRGAPNIKRLFHGTAGVGALAIAAKGFSKTALTVNHGQMLGNGFYLAEHFSKSAQYIKGFLAEKGEGYVIAFDVALGKVLRSGAANHDYKILSVNHGLSDEWPRYDSVKAMPHRSNGLVMTEYMIRNERAARQAVPRYLIGATVSD